LLGVEIEALPRAHTDAVPAEARRAFIGGEHSGRGRQQVPAGMIEIIEVVIVAEEDIIERTDSFRCEGRARQLPQRYGSRGVFTSGRIERRVCQEADAAEFEQSRRSADVSEVEGVG
jgi:hypothetical protein